MKYKVYRLPKKWRKGKDMAEKETSRKNIVVEGTLIKARREKKSFKGNEVNKFNVTVAEVELTDEQKNILKEAFKDSGVSFTPSWVKDFEGYVNVGSSEFAIPFKDAMGKKYDSLEDEVDDGLPYMGAKVRMALNVKQGAVYPKAIVFLTEGEPYNPFNDFE